MVRARPQAPITRLSPAAGLAWGQRLIGIQSPTTRQLVGRSWSVVLILVLGLSLMGLRLGYLQVIQAESLQKMAADQQQARLRPFIPRRSIVDRQSLAGQRAELLAVDRPSYTLWAHPVLYLTLGSEQIAQKLAPLLNLSEGELAKLLIPNRSSRIQRWLTVEVADQVRSLNLDGLELVSERQRVYPQKEMAAEVVGYVDLDHRGQAGLEYSQQELLERKVQPLTVVRNGYGQLLASAVPEGLLQSSESLMQLTLDMRLQRAARQILATQMAKFSAARGTVIVMEPKTGQILSLVSEPTYDPNRYFSGYDPAVFRNWAVTDLYEPGSTFKPLNVTMALEAGAIQPDTRVYDEGRITLGGWPVQNFDYRQRGPHGWISVEEILKQSSNVGMVHLMQRMDPAAYYTQLTRLGLNQRIGVDLPFDPVSHLKSSSQFLRVSIERATTAFGQGFSLTPLGLISMHCTIANGGFKITPYIVQGLVERETGTTVWQPSRPDPVRLFSEVNTRTVRAMMRSVVDSGTGKLAQIAGYEIAGKTGTAQVANPNGGGYIPGRRITSFIGYFPALNPTHVVLAVVDDPKGDDAYGSTVAAPIVRAVIQEIIAMTVTAQAMP